MTPQDLEEIDIPASLSGKQGARYVRPLQYLFTFEPRERVRTRIALWLLGTLVVLTFAIFSVYAAGVISESAFKSLVVSLFTPILGVFGTVTGFYYGEHSKEKKDKGVK